MTRRWQLVVLTRARPEQEAALHRWYDEEHLDDILDVPGILSGTRSRIELVKGGGDAAEWHSLAVYELEADDPRTVLDEISRRRQAGLLRWTDALAGEATLQMVGEPTRIAAGPAVIPASSPPRSC